MAHGDDMRGGSLTGRICLAALLVWALAMIVPDFYSVVSPLGAVGFAADNDGVVFDVRLPFETEADSPAWQAGLRVGDRLDLQIMHCRRFDAPACVDLTMVLGGMGGVQRVTVGQTVTLYLVGAEGVSGQTVTMTAVAPELGWVTRGLVLANELTGVFFVLAAAWLVYLRPGRMSWGFFLYAIWFNPGHSFVYYLLLQQRPVLLLAQEAAGALAQGAGYAGLLQFALRVPSDELKPQWRSLERALPLVAGVLTVWQLAIQANLFGVPTESLSRSSFLVGFVVDALALFILFSRLNGLTPQNRQRMWWVIVGCLFGMPAYILSSIIQSTSLLNRGLGVGDVSPAIVEALLLVQGILAWFVFEAVRRPRVVSVASPLRRLTLFGLVLSVPVVMLRQSIEPAFIFVHVQTNPPDWVWLIIGSVVLYIMGRLHKFAVGKADHIFNRAFRREALSLNAAIEAVLRADGMDAIERILVEPPERSLRLASAAVFRNETGGLIRTHSGLGWTAAHARTLEYSNPALAGLATATPVVFEPEAAARLGFPDGLPAPVFVVPVADRIRCYAVAMYGPHATGADLNAEEQAMLRKLADAAAVAYAHAENSTLRRELDALRERPPPDKVASMLARST